MEDISVFPPVDCDPLYAMSRGGEKFFLLVSSVELGVFDLCRHPIQAGELADALHADRGVTEKLIRALTAIGLMEKKNGAFQNSSISQVYLTENSPFYQGHFLRHTAWNITKRWTGLGACIRGELSENLIKRNLNPDFTRAMAESAMRGGLQQTVDIVTSLEAFSRARKMLDLGGAHGLYAIAFCQKNHLLEATIMDRQHALGVARPLIEKYGMLDRVTMLESDYSENFQAEGLDIVFASDSLYWSKEKLRIFLGNIRKSLNPGGLFISKHWQFDDAGRISPEAAALFDLMLSVGAESAPTIFDTESYVTLLRSVGFTTELFDISTPAQPSRLFVCRIN